MLGSSAETVAEAGGGSTELQIGAPKLEPWQASTSLTLDRVGLSYEGEAALKDISCSFVGFRKYGIVGPSGCGKTTLAQLLTGVLQPTEGSIAINGQSVETLSTPSWKKQVAYLPQSPHIFSTTLRNNLTFYQPDATEEEIIEAAKCANIHDFIMELPDQYDTFVGERGARLSGGQKQRISIARVFLKNPPILILDEATSALDNELSLIHISEPTRP